MFKHCKWCTHHMSMCLCVGREGGEVIKGRGRGIVCTSAFVCVNACDGVDR